MKSLPGRGLAPQSSGMGRISPVHADALYGNPYLGSSSYGPFLPRPASVFTNGAFAPAAPIQPVPVDEPPPGGLYPDPRLWEYRQSWNLPTPPGTEGLKLASFAQLATLANRYSVLRSCLDLRIQELRGLEWDITLTTDAAKAYRDDRAAMRDFGERRAKLKKFFSAPDPDYWSFSAFFNALLEEIFVYDALSLIFRPKFGASFGMGGRGLLGSELDSLRLISGPTIRPLIDLHGGHPQGGAPAYQQFLYGVPRSDYLALATGRDIDDAGLAGAEVNVFSADVMLYAPYWSRRETPYGQPPVEKALLPIISGLQKQEYQLDYFTQGTVPAVYISPGDTNITPTQIGELQSALNALAGDPAYHLKVVVLPPGSRVEPQRPVDLSDSFDYLVQTQVCMACDVSPIEVGIIPDIGGGQQGPSSSGIRFASQETRDIKSRKSTKPLLRFIADIFNQVIQVVCRSPDMQFQFEGLIDDEDKQAITELGVQQVQNGIASIDEVRERLDLPPWGLQETSEPVVFTAQGPVPFSMAPELIAAAAQGRAPSGQGTNSGQDTRHRTSQPTVRQGGQTRPNGSHPAPLAPHREAPATPAHAAAAGTVQSPTPRTGGTTSRSSVAGSRKKAVLSELDALKRHLRKGREITSWEPVHITNGVLGMIAEDTARGVLLDTAVERAASISLRDMEPIPPLPYEGSGPELDPRVRAYRMVSPGILKQAHFPGWQHDLALAGEARDAVSGAFTQAQGQADKIRHDVATGKLAVTGPVMNGLIGDAVQEAFSGVLEPFQARAWDLGYESAKALVTGAEPVFGASHDSAGRQGFLDTEGAHWLQQIARTGLVSTDSRTALIARTEIARAIGAGALAAYRDLGVAYKHLLVSPDERACEICKNAEDDGVIALDAPFSSGGLAGFCHPGCRCIAGPAGISATPPMESVAKSRDDDSRLAWLLIRARDEDGRKRYLLQQRDDGAWGMPGGKTHQGENPWHAAVREVTEEIGELPALTPVSTFHHVDPDGTQVYLYLCEAPYFRPALDGDTPEETRGTGWFRRKEIADLDLAGKFRDDWDGGLDEALKQIAVTENGEWLDDEDRHGAGLGARWPYPHRGDGAEEPPDDKSGETVSRLYPEGSQDARHPSRRGVPAPAQAFPVPGGDMWPQGGIGSSPGPGAVKRKKTSKASVHYRDGSPQQNCGNCAMYHDHACDLVKGRIEPQDVCDEWVTRQAAKNDAGHPVVGAFQPQAPKPAKPRSYPPEAFDPADTVEEWTPEGDTVKGAADYSDPNPVEAEHVYLLMSKNFPPDAIAWVKRARWTGPVWVPWNRVDTDDREKWAASHQSGKVNEFARAMQAHDGHVAPSILVQEPNSNRAFIVDGHHRALAREKLGQKVLAYLGNIEPRDRMAAMETHSLQIHSGSSPENK